MRFIVASCALLSLCSAVRAVPINITDISGTWIAQDDALELRFEFDRPPVLTNDFVTFVGYTSLDLPQEAVNIRGEFPPAGTMVARSVYVYQKGGGPLGEEVQVTLSDWHTVEHSIDGNTLTVVLDVPELNLMGNELVFSARTSEWSDRSIHGVTREGLLLLHAPEPSAMAMAAIGVVGLLLHRLRRHRPRAHCGAGFGSGSDHRG